MDNGCLHESFECHSKVGRITAGDNGPVTDFTLELKIRCCQCKEWFEFVGVPGGVSWSHPTTNFDFTELRAPIRPATGTVQTSLNYEVKKQNLRPGDVN